MPVLWTTLQRNWASWGELGIHANHLSLRFLLDALLSSCMLLQLVGGEAPPIERPGRREGLFRQVRHVRPVRFVLHGARNASSG